MRWLFISVILLLPVHALANVQSFAEWSAAFKKEAMTQGISESLLNKAFTNLTPNERVIELDRTQPEGKLSLMDYLDGALTPDRVSTGRRMMQKHSALLNQIGEKYGVQPRFIVALWGKETSYGGYTGNMSTIRSLATLAYDGRRSDFFRAELMAALTIIQQGHITLDGMKGSWAGALGQCQFMPTTFLKYAVDENGDGRKDIWNSHADIFASMANYLAQIDWNKDETWGRAVRVPPELADTLLTGKEWKSLSEWQALGVRNADGSNLPNKELQAALTAPGDRYEGVYIIYKNFDVLLEWNRSRYFATAVGLLSERIR